VGTHWGSTHVEALRKASPDVRIFICGRDEARTSHMAKTLHAENYFLGLDKALADPRVEAVTLALPHHLHRDAAVASLEAGKHVLVEKPLSTSIADASAMIAAGRSSGKVFMVAENMHYRPTLRAVCERILAGDAGEPLQITMHAGGPRYAEGWVADAQKSGGGVFMDIGIHYVRAMRLLVGEPDHVVAFRSMQIQTKMTGEDGLIAMFSSRYGWNCQITTTWAAVLGKVPDIIVLGDEGTFHLWPLTGYYDYYPKGDRLLTEIIGYVRPYWLRTRLMRPELQRERVKVEGEDTGYPQEMSAFLEAVSSGIGNVTSAIDARRDLEIVLDTYRAASSGKSQAIKALD
jgi:predicted dehydrogenase